MNPFVYGKSFLGKSFSKKMGTLTPPNPKTFRGAQCAPLERVFTVFTDLKNSLLYVPRYSIAIMILHHIFDQSPQRQTVTLFLVETH